MKQAKWLLLAGLVVMMMTIGCQKQMGFVEPKDDVNIAWHYVNPPQQWTLWAGQSIDAGTVTVWNVGTTLYVKYVTTGDWWLDQTQVAVATSLDGIPHNKQGSPLPGQFPYQTTHNPRVQEYTYAIPWETGWYLDQELFVATHASLVKVVNGTVVQQQSGWAGDHQFPGKNWALYFHFSLKETYKDVNLPTGYVTMHGHYPGASSYWDIDLSGVPTGYDVWDGKWRGWCAEQFVYMYPEHDYQVTLWSTCDPLLPGRCGAPADWAYVNYLLNHKASGATTLQIEQAIWYLMHNGDYPSDPVAKAMVDDALANGQGWLPRHGDWIAVVMESPSDVQLCFIEVDP